MSADSKPVRVMPAIRRLLSLSGRLQSWLYLAVGLALIEAVTTVASNFWLGRAIDAVLTGDGALCHGPAHQHRLDGRQHPAQFRPHARARAVF